MQARSVLSIFSNVFSCLYMIILCIWYFTSEFGYMLAICAGVLALTITVTLRQVRQGVTFRKQIHEKNSELNKLMSEIFNSIKMLKLFGWELLFKERVLKLKDDIYGLQD